MKFARFGILLQVHDLDLCRSFYRDVLHLGEPATDSSFAVEFLLAEDFVLRLEKNTSPALEHASSAVSWTLECEAPEVLYNELADAGYDIAEESRESGPCYRGLDPEGNPFYIIR